MADRIVVMHDGNIEQIGTPLELYDRPANTFVAAFIGSPSMNMIAGTLKGTDFVADDGTTTIAVGAVSGSADGQRVTLGIRPEHFSLDPAGAEAEIVTVEPTGSETQVHMKLAGQDVVGVFRERIGVGPGDKLKVSPDLNKLHLFEAQSGQRLAIPSDSLPLEERTLHEAEVRASA